MNLVGGGIGSYLNVHETPPRISSHNSTFDNPLLENMFLSIEPGIYKEGDFGIRIENLVIIVKNKKLSRGDKTFLCFEPVTLCPFDIPEKCLGHYVTNKKYHFIRNALIS